MNLEQARFNLIEQQIRPNNISDPLVLATLAALKRDKFVVPRYSNLALADMPLPLPGQQHMLTPVVEARMLQALQIKKTDKILEVGTGSGYLTALLARLGDFVYTFEINALNQELAKHNLMNAGVTNVLSINSNGIYGFNEKAPFDKIVLGGGLVNIPQSLKSQLKPGGILFGFVGKRPIMHAVVITCESENNYIEKRLFETDVDYLINGYTERFEF